MQPDRNDSEIRLTARDDSSTLLATLRQGRSALRWRFSQATARLPFLFVKELIYDERFFETNEVEEGMYGHLADALYELRMPRSVVDVGCGPGLLLARFAEKGVEVCGIEGSRAAISRSRVADRITRANLERGVPLLGRFDVCFCIEVAEHLPKRTARKLVTGLTALSDLVVFTAATPGQGGRHHVNEQPHSYWRALFENAGFVESSLADDVRQAIADIPDPVWMHTNLMVFERAPRGAAT